jgi:hypothetical protein
MDIQSLNLSLVVRELVEELLSLSEVVTVLPVLDPGLQGLGVESVLKADAF